MSHVDEFHFHYVEGHDILVPHPTSVKDCPQCKDLPVSDLRQRIEAVRKWPDKCCAEVSRNGESQPCDKPAVAVADGDAESDAWWPVCPHHSRGRRMVPLAVLLKALSEGVYADGYQDAVRYAAHLAGRRG